MNTQRRVYIDCREYPTDKPCTLAISGTEEEVLDLAVLHAVTRHGFKEGPQLKDQIRQMLKEEKGKS